MRRFKLSLVLIAVGLGTAQAADNNLTVVGGMDFGFKRLSLAVDSGSGSGGGNTGPSFKPSYVTIIPNLALGYGAFYGSLSYEKSIDANSAIGQDSSLTTEVSFARKDTTATLGYRVTSSFNVFAGYTNGSNQFKERTVEGGLYSVKEITYTEKGPFAGGSYNHAVGDKGNLSLSLAYGELKGDFKMVKHGGSTPKADETAKGDNTGLSYGITWSGPLAGSLNYRVGVKATEYRLKKGEESTLEITEKYTTYFMGLMSYF